MGHEKRDLRGKRGEGKEKGEDSFLPATEKGRSQPLFSRKHRGRKEKREEKRSTFSWKMRDLPPLIRGRWKEKGLACQEKALSPLPMYTIEAVQGKKGEKSTSHPCKAIEWGEKDLSSPRPARTEGGKRKEGTFSSSGTEEGGRKGKKEALHSPPPPNL